MKKVLLLTAFMFSLFLGKTFSQTVYYNDAGTKYHTKACKSVGPTSTKSSLHDALNYSKRPCPDCHPPTKVVVTKKKGPVKKKAAPKKAPAKTTTKKAPAKK